jgi:hypothetical protein
MGWEYSIHGQKSLIYGITLGPSLVLRLRTCAVIPPLPTQCVFMTWCLVKDREKCVLTARFLFGIPHVGDMTMNGRIILEQAVKGTE